MRCWWGLFGILLFGIVSVHAQETYEWQMVAEGFTFVTAIVQPANDSTRLFVADLHGTVHVIENGVLLEEPFIDISELITTETYGQGLTGMVFHPDYAENGYFYIS